MPEETKKHEPLELIRDMWSRMGFPMPGMVTPTLSLDQLDKRITELRAVEEWLKVSLNMLQMSIQGLEVQRATLATMKAFRDTVGTPEGGANLFANPTLWPWNLLQPQTPQSDETPKAAPAPEKPPKK